MNSEGEVLGLTYFGPVEGSPLFPPELVTLYFILALILIGIVYVWLHHKRKPVLLRHKIKLFFLTAVMVKAFLVLAVGILAAYWLIPLPNIQQTTPVNMANGYGVTQNIEIIFDRPVSRSSLEKVISPETPGVWVFEDSLYTTHFYRKLVFHPTISLKPETEYKITLTNIRNVLKSSEASTYDLSFKTQPTPKVLSVEPISGSEQVSIDSPIIVNLTEANDKLSEFDIALKPEHPVTITRNKDNSVFTLLPIEPLRQGTKYEIAINKTDLVYNLASNTIIERQPQASQYSGFFTTKEAPGIEHFEPTGSNILLNTPITITFSQPMNQKSVEEQLQLVPATTTKLSWTDERTLVITSSLKYDTTYTLKINAGAKSAESGFITEDIHQAFTTIGPVRVANFSPKDGVSALAIKSPIKVIFDQAVDRPSAESSFVISPEVNGTFSWNENTLIFTPSSPLAYSTSYTVSVNPGIKSKLGLPSTQTYHASFTTQQQTVKLAVPAYLQQHTLSCEISALRMALAFRGVQVSENQLLEQIGVDPTPHQGNVWGDPHQAFVGNVNGNQMADGYGVHWEPIARVARLYRGAQAFEGWSIEQLTQTLTEGNPVVIWVYSSGGWPTTWSTPEGKNIAAARDEHAVTAVGFVGPAHNPSEMIINDPLYGQVQWTRSLFDKKWNILNRSGVIIF